MLDCFAFSLSSLVFLLGIVRLQDFCCRKPDANPAGSKRNSSLFSFLTYQKLRKKKQQRREMLGGKAQFKEQCDICSRTAWYKLAVSTFMLKPSKRVSFFLSRGWRLRAELPARNTRGALRGAQSWVSKEVFERLLGKQEAGLAFPRAD